MKRFFAVILLMLVFTSGHTQNNPLDKFSLPFGKWEGTGEGFGSSKSVIHSEFTLVMNNKYI